MIAQSFEGIVTWAVDFGDADRIARLLTPSRGRVSVLLRGARASRRRFAGLAEVGNSVQIEASEGNSELWVARSGEVLRAPLRARDHLDRLALLWYGAELCAALAPENHPCEKLPKLLEVWISLLEGAATPQSAARVGLEAKALTFAGLNPSLLTCARCGAPISDPAVFDPAAGGALHASCGEGVATWLRALLAMEAARRTPLAEMVEADSAAGWLLSDFAAWHLGRPFASRALLEEVATPLVAR